jgi:glutamine synthetase
MDDELKNFLELSYEEIEEMNLKARAITDPAEAKATHIKYLDGEKHIKAVTLCFSDIEGRLHMLDYDKKFFLDSLDNLTFDGSSIKGLSELHESDLRLSVDWISLTFVPADIFGAGKVMPMCATVILSRMSRTSVVSCKPTPRALKPKTAWKPIWHPKSKAFY